MHQVGFIGNVVGALKVEIVGHRRSIEKSASDQGDYRLAEMSGNACLTRQRRLPPWLDSYFDTSPGLLRRPPK